VKHNAKLLSESTVIQNLHRIVEVPDQAFLPKRIKIDNATVIEALQAAHRNLGVDNAEMILKTTVLRESAVPRGLTTLKSRGLEAAGTRTLTIGTTTASLNAAATMAAGNALASET
jgi:hypothetical protein